MLSVMSRCQDILKRNELFMANYEEPEEPLGTFAFVKYVLDLNNNCFKM